MYSQLFNSSILWFLELFMYNYWDLTFPTNPEELDVLALHAYAHVFVSVHVTKLSKSEMSFIEKYFTSAPNKSKGTSFL